MRYITQPLRPEEAFAMVNSDAMAATPTAAGLDLHASCDRLRRMGGLQREMEELVLNHHRTTYAEPLGKLTTIIP